MAGIQWNLLDTQMPAKVATAFNPLGSFNEGQATAQKLQMNQLAMDKARQDLEYNPMKLYMKQQEQQAKAQKITAQTEKTEVETQIKAHELRRNAADLVASTSDDMILETAIQQARSMASTLGASPEIVANAEAHLTQIYNTGGPAALRQEALAQSQDAKTKVAAMLGQTRLDQNQQSIDLRARQGDERIAQGWENVRTGQMNAQTGQGNLAVNRQRLMQPNVRVADDGQNLNFYDAKGGGTVYEPLPIQNQPSVAMTEDAKIAAAHRYLLDGTLPSVGIGKQGATLRAEILNRAAELAGARGIAPEDQRPAQIGVAATKSALTQVAKQEGMVGAFERNFVKNVELAEKASKEVDRTGIPIVNKWINAGKRAVTGDVALSKFDIAIKAAVNEYTKIISGSMGNTVMAQSEIERVNSLLNAAQTQEQVQGVLDFMKLETKNRMAGFAEEKGRMQGDLKLPGGQPPIQQPSPATGPVTIKSDDDYNALPSGTVFTAPDGSIRRKP